MSDDDDITIDDAQIHTDLMDDPPPWDSSQLLLVVRASPARAYLLLRMHMHGHPCVIVHLCCCACMYMDKHVKMGTHVYARP